MTRSPLQAPPEDGERRERQKAIQIAVEEFETVASERDRLAEQVRVLEARLQAAGPPATPLAGIDEEIPEDIDTRVRTLADLAEGIHASPGRLTPAPRGAGAGSLGSFTAVIDALAAELDTPRAEMIHRMIEDLKKRIAMERAMLAHLRLLEEADCTAKRMPHRRV